jgi:hypothetical protein
MTIQVLTPMATFAAMRKYENEIAKDRKKREQRAGLPESERYSELRQYREWTEYAGEFNAPVVTVSILPEYGETSGSALTRLLLGANMQQTWKFRADVRGAVVFRNDSIITPIRSGHVPMRMYVDNSWMCGTRPEISKETQVPGIPESGCRARLE